MYKRLYIFILLILFMQDLYSQCAMCKAVAQEEVNEEGVSGINMGILYIMAIPYIILFIVFRKKIFAFLKELKKATGFKHS